MHQHNQRHGTIAKTLLKALAVLAILPITFMITYVFFASDPKKVIAQDNGGLQRPVMSPGASHMHVNPPGFTDTTYPPANAPVRDVSATDPRLTDAQRASLPPGAYSINLQGEPVNSKWQPIFSSNATVLGGVVGPPQNPFGGPASLTPSYLANFGASLLTQPGSNPQANQPQQVFFGSRSGQQAMNPRVAELLMKFHEIPQHDEARVEARDAAINAIKGELGSEFDKMHASQQKEIDQVAKRLESLKRVHEKRLANKSRIVELRAAQLVGEPDELRWETGTAGPGTSSQFYYFNDTRPNNELHSQINSPGAVVLPPGAGLTHPPAVISNFIPQQNPMPAAGSVWPGSSTFGEPRAVIEHPAQQDLPAQAQQDLLLQAQRELDELRAKLRLQAEAMSRITSEGQKSSPEKYQSLLPKTKPDATPADVEKPTQKLLEK